MTVNQHEAYYVDIILPGPMPKPFTYRINREEAMFLRKGMRVSVPFHGKKIRTGIVYSVHQNEPAEYEVKDIHNILDEEPILSKSQFQLLDWISKYYMSSLGESLRTAIPSVFLLQSDTVVSLKPEFEYDREFNDHELNIIRFLKDKRELDLQKLRDFTGKKNITSTIRSLFKKEVIDIKEVIFDKYTPKYINYAVLNPEWNDEEKLTSLLDSLPAHASGQRKAILTYFTWKNTRRDHDKIPLSEWVKLMEGKRSSIQSLVKKGVFHIEKIREDRVGFTMTPKELPVLNREQSLALVNIKKAWKSQNVCLLHGVTGSGKTEVYMHLIKEIIERGGQVLYLVPEISLTTQLINRLQQYFSEDLLVYHSRYNLQERYEIWNKILTHRNDRGQLIIGARSAVLLPFRHLQLIIVDEEHESSYKQFDPAPRYQARDTSVMLGKITGAKTLLGTATPSIESYRNSRIGKYALVKLTKRYDDVPMPDIHLLNLKEAMRKKRIEGYFSQALIKMMTEVLERNKQIILFQNRRGYAPVSICHACGHSPQCPNCDVSLTYHRYSGEMHCHYCGYHETRQHTCPVCGTPGMDLLGLGTQQVEADVKKLFPEARSARLDYDTTRGKNAFQHIIKSFQDREIDILIGTKMVAKGLDFPHVELVGVIQADILLNFPDFRAHERSFQMLTQVAGRAGRHHKKGQVIIQTYNPAHPVLQNVKNNDFLSFYQSEVEERNNYEYPPFVRIIKIALKHKEFFTVQQAADWLASVLQSRIPIGVLGPADPPIPRIKNLYIKELSVKIPLDARVGAYKEFISSSIHHLLSIPDYRRVRISINVE